MVLTRVEAFDRRRRNRRRPRPRPGRGLRRSPASEPRPLLAEHARAHAAAFGDVALDLGVDAAERRLPVGELLARQAARPDRPLPALLEKLFESGRYLLLSASGLLPPRLTGLWQGDWNSAWSGAITTDANLGLQLAGAVTTDVPGRGGRGGQPGPSAAAGLAGQRAAAVRRPRDRRPGAHRRACWPDHPLRAALAAAHVDGGSGLAARLRCSTRPWPVATPGTRLRPPARRCASWPRSTRTS